MFGFSSSSWAASLVSKIFQEQNLENLVSQHAEDRATTARVTHKHPTGLKPLESRLIFVTARAAVVLKNEIEPGHGERKMIYSSEFGRQKSGDKHGGFAGVLRAGAAPRGPA